MGEGGIKPKIVDLVKKNIPKYLPIFPQNILIFKLFPHSFHKISTNLIKFFLMSVQYKSIFNYTKIFPYFP